MQYGKVKVLWFLVPQLLYLLKGTSSFVCSLETLLLHALFYLTVPSTSSYRLGSNYPIVCLGLILLRRSYLFY